jgi:hypothetical protein
MTRLDAAKTKITFKHLFIFLPPYLWKRIEQGYPKCSAMD